MAAKKAKTAKEVQKLLARKTHHVMDRLSGSEKKKMESLREGYKSFLSQCKTERESAAHIEKRAIAAGFKPASGKSKSKKFYSVYENKVIGLGVLGTESVEQGVNMVISHIDAPRLDLKGNPVYEDCNLALGKTHYYGGIKKYQWVSRPLAMHGVVILGNGSKIEVNIGESDDDPVFTILDLLPHLAKKAQYPKKLEEIVTGEKLNIVMGGIPYGTDAKGKNRIKLTVLDILNTKYGMVEEDLISAELEIVPAGKARDVGLDRAFIGGYGQDDRICAFTSASAIFETKPGKRAQVVLCVDKEEIGSFGSTGAGARVVLDFIGELLEKEGKTSERAIRRAMANSKILSADVNAAVNPDWQQVHDKRNAALTGHGICLSKFTGSRGKSGSSDASAEFVGEIRNLFNKHKVVWQAGELGKVDEGGGGTVALHLAKHGAQVLDAGVALLAMHSPMEIAHVGDLYSAFKAYKVFMEKA
jgi:aspartyl aminopeptidase